jgi:hypothetical protein
MRIVVCLICILLSFETYAQKSINTYLSIPAGIGVEYGKISFDSTRIGGFLGLAVDLNKNADFELYAKGHYLLSKYLHALALVGVQDLKKMTVGIGVRYYMPINEKLVFILEPILHSEQSRINAGVSFKL